MTKTEIVKTIDKALAEISVQMQLHNGSISLIDFTDGIAYIELEGACAGCPASACGVMANLEQKLKAAVPEVSKVVAL